MINIINEIANTGNTINSKNDVVANACTHVPISDIGIAYTATLYIATLHDDDSITLIHSANAVNSTVIVMAPEPMLHTLIAYTADRLSVRYALKKNANIRHSEKNAMTINVIFNTVLNNDIMIMFSEQFSANMLAIAVHVNIPNMNLKP